MKINKDLHLSKKAEIYAIESHSSTNHYYDLYLPYQFHLRMVIKAAEDFIKLVPEEWRESVFAACWCHDTIEDARQTYNNVLSVIGKEGAEIVRAVTNYGRGRDRNERMPDFIYEDIRNTPYATFVKLCDRIANVQYSKMTGSSMFEKYKKENVHFKKMLFVGNEYVEVWEYLDQLFEA